MAPVKGPVGFGHNSPNINNGCSALTEGCERITGASSVKSSTGDSLSMYQSSSFPFWDGYISLFSARKYCFSSTVSISGPSVFC